MGSGDRSGTGRSGGSSNGSSRITVWFILQQNYILISLYCNYDLRFFEKWYYVTFNESIPLRWHVIQNVFGSIFGTVGRNSPNVLKWNKVLVNKGLIDFGQDVHAFCHLPEYGMHSIQVIKILTSCNKELKTRITADLFKHHDTACRKNLKNTVYHLSQYTVYHIKYSN